MGVVTTAMFRAILSESELHCADYQLGPHGVDLYNDDGDFVAFVPFQNLECLINDDTYETDDAAIM